MPLWVLSVTKLCSSCHSCGYLFVFNLKAIVEPTELHHPGKLRHGILFFTRHTETLWNLLKTCKIPPKLARCLCPGPGPMWSTQWEGQRS